MQSKIYVLAGLLIAGSTIASASTAIGTATARGDIRVDGYAVSGNATLFDGSAVQTDAASATIRIDKGTEIKLATGSMGTLFHDHMILDHGSSQLSSDGSYRLDAGSFSVMPADGKALGRVSVSDKGAVEVAAISGELKVVDPVGNLVRTVLPGKPMAFAIPAEETAFRGNLTASGGNFFVTDATGTMHQVVLKDADGKPTSKGLQKFVGKDVNIVGQVDASASPAGGASNVFVISHIASFNAAGSGLSSSTVPVIITAAGAFAFLIAGIYYSSQTPTTASR